MLLRSLKLVLISLVIPLLAAGCGVWPWQEAEKEKVQTEDLCRNAICAESYHTEKQYLGCDGQSLKVETEPHNASEHMIRVPSQRNLQIEYGELSHPRTSDSIFNHDEWGGDSKFHRESFWVSIWDRPGTLRLEKGLNLLSYAYYSCSEKVCQPGFATCYCPDRRQLLESGERTFFVRVKSIVNRRCTLAPSCLNGQVISYPDCLNPVDLTNPYVLSTEW